MKLYWIDESYLKLLHSKDDNVFYFSKKRNRPYVGVVLNVKGAEFFAPLSSPKKWHETIRDNDPCFFRIVRGSRLLGVVRICNMIPVNRSNYHELNFGKLHGDYLSLVNEQTRVLSRNRPIIKKKARTLWEISSKCCNFHKLLKNTH